MLSVPKEPGWAYHTYGGDAFLLLLWPCLFWLGSWRGAWRMGGVAMSEMIWGVVIVDCILRWKRAAITKLTGPRTLGWKIALAAAVIPHLPAFCYGGSA